MNQKTQSDSIRRVMTAGFTAQDIAEPLVSFDRETSAQYVLSIMDRMSFDYVGIRDSGSLVGFAAREDLQAETSCGETMQKIEEHEIVSDAATLAEVVHGLVDRPKLFVSLLGAIGGIVTRQDLSKPPIRMWLFGMISIIEQRFVSLILNRFGDGEWSELLSAGRLDKAKQLLAERQRRRQNVALIDCLQLSDKGTIIARDRKLRETLQFESRRRFEDLLRKLESLRNNLAHSQDIVEGDWETIVLLSENLDRVIDGPPNHGSQD